MNILFIGTTDNLGGAAKISWELKSHLEKDGHFVSMFVADKHSNDKNVHIIPRVFWRKLLDFLFTTDTFTYTDWILQTEEFKNADLVHCHNLHGRFFNLKTLKKMSDLKPVVWTLHDEWAITPHCACTLQGTEIKNGLYVCPSKKTQPRILWDNTKHLAQQKLNIYKAANLNLVCPSHWLLNRVSKTILSQQDLRHIQNGINSRVFQSTEKSLARETLKLPQDKKIVLFSAVGGKDNPWKGWEYASKLVEKNNHNDSILFLNLGNLNSESKKEDNLEYRPRVTDEEEMALYYSAADVLLFTSVAENLPLVILEAMSCGTPIVSFDVGGVAEVMTHKINGYVAKYRDVEDLDLGLKWALSLDNDSMNSLKENSSRKIREQYDISKVYEEYQRLYTELI